MNNKKIGLVIVGIIILVGAFYGGMVYGKSQTPTKNQGMQAFGQNGPLGVKGSARGAGGFTIGQIIAKDTNSITVQLIAEGVGQGGSATPFAGGSKIVFVDNNTKVTKSVDGTISDLAIGTQVSIIGTPNADGSENAQTVQIRSVIPTTKQ
ncbi:MAG: hypothetical protein WCW93_01695 [Candidatus Paceibacterota bacterium]